MNFDQMMAELRAEYLASFPQKLSEIEKRLAEKDFVHLRDDFHKLKGTGKTYGIPEISELCEVVEKICLQANETKIYDHAHLVVTMSLPILKSIVQSRLNGQELKITDKKEFADIRAMLK